MAGIQALIDQSYGRQGDANFVYYKLAARQSLDLPFTACAASRIDGTMPDSACVFHMINGGSIATPCGPRHDGGKIHDCFGSDGVSTLGELSKSNTVPEPAYQGRIGYNLATGLGSMDATNLYNAWADWWK